MTRQKIAVVDDDEQILDLLSRVFEADYDVYTAIDGRKGLELIKAEGPFISFLDVNMPELTGLAVLTELKQLGVPGAVWMLSVDDDIELAKKAITYGATGYITKPFELKTITDVVAAAAQALKR